MVSEKLLTAAWVAPMTRAAIPESGVVFRAGRVAAIGRIDSLRAAHPQAEIHDLGNAVILPGLVNAHTHLELSLLQRAEKPARFVDWIINLMRTAPAMDCAAAVDAGIEQCLRFGVTTVGDITSQPAISRPLLAKSLLRGNSYGEVRAMAQRRGLLQERLEAAVEPMEIGPVHSGISPHAPYSIEADGYQRALEWARKLELPLATHLAETPDEAAFLADHAGPFKELWDLLGAWDAQVPRFIGGPIRFAQRMGLLDYPTLLAHVNYCDNDELQLLASGRASVVYCPRTHAFFDHPAHRWREMLAHGINVAIGTDSCASSPDLNLVEELRLLHRIAPEVEALALWQMVTTRAAKSLAYEAVGTLNVGAVADAAVFPVFSQDPLGEILRTDVLPTSLWIGGERVAPAT